MSALDRVLDGLERRLMRRERQFRAIESKVVAARRVGHPLPDDLRLQYRDAVARYDEARLALNAALAIDKSERRP